MHRPGRAAEALGGLGEREALEVAEHHRQPGRRGQAVDLGVEGLGPLAIEQGAVGWDGRVRLGTLHGPALLAPAGPRQPVPGIAGRAGRDAIKPVAQPVGVADRARPPRQDEEGGLEGVLGIMAIAQELAADAQHHRPVSGHQRRESGLGPQGPAAADEPLDELAVREPGDRAAGEERLDLPDHRRRQRWHHGRQSPRRRPRITSIPSLGTVGRTVLLSVVCPPDCPE